MTKRKSFIIHHSADADGRISGLIASEYYKENGYDVVLIPWDYHYNEEELVTRLSNEMTDGDVVAVTDLSLSKPLMESLHEDEHIHFVWIDHHISAIKEFDSLGIPGLRIDGVAACELAWRYFFGTNIAPDPIVLAGQYDVWNKEGRFEWDSKVIPFQYFLRSLKMDIENEESYEILKNVALNSSTEHLVGLGEMIVDYEKVQCSKLPFFKVEFEGVEFLAVNKPGGSTVFEFAGVTGPSLMSFAHCGNDMVKFSMYKGTVQRDLSVIAKKWGGGGHANACGFHVDNDKASAILRGEYK